MPASDEKPAASAVASTGGKKQKLYPGTVLRSEARTKIQVKPNFARDITIGVSLLASLFWLIKVGVSDIRRPRKPGGVGRPDRNRLQKQQKKIKQWQEELAHLTSIPEESELCAIYIAESSIPLAGFGLFAGRGAEEGAVVLDSGDPLFLSDHFTIPRHGMIIKPHPLLSNVENVDGKYIAKKDILPGEELFVSMPEDGTQFANAYYSLFTHVPSQESYRLADKMITEEYSQLPNKKVPKLGSYVQKKQELMSGEKKKVGAGGGVGFKAPSWHSVIDVDDASLKVIQNIVGRYYDARVAALLPDTSDGLLFASQSGTGVALGMLKNQTLTSLYHQGQCFDGIRIAQDADERVTSTVHRNLAPGDIIASIPLYIVDAEKASSKLGGQCISFGDVPALFCPLSDIRSIKRKKQSESEEGDYNDGPNAEFQWSPWASETQRALNRDLGEVIDEYRFSLSVDLVATREIKAEEEVFVAGDELLISAKPLPLKESIVPKAWKEEL